MKCALPAALVAALSLLSACGGGNPPPENGVTLTGVVAVGAPLAGANIEIWCGIDDEQVGTATTDAKGVYTTVLARPCDGPLLLHTAAPATTNERLVTIGPDPASGVDPSRIHINITPLTTILAQAQHQTTDIEEMRRKQADMKKKTVDARRKELERQKQRVEEALARIREIMKGVPEMLLSLQKLRDTPFDAVRGDPMDELLETFAKLRGTVTPEALLQQLQPTGGTLADGKPWKTLFGKRTSITLTGTECSGGGGVTATLRMQGDDLRIDLESDIGTGSFVVGPAVESEFEFSVSGVFPHVTLYAVQGAQYLELYGESQPVVGFGIGGSMASCKLATPILRTDLADFHLPHRILSVAPGGTSGTCPPGSGPGFDYAISPLGDVRFDGKSLAADWLEAIAAAYREQLSFNVPGASGHPAYSVWIMDPAGRYIRPYYDHTVPYGVTCF